jgi:hypothetical protein
VQKAPAADAPGFKAQTSVSPAPLQPTSPQKLQQQPSGKTNP